VQSAADIFIHIRATHAGRSSAVGGNAGSARSRKWRAPGGRTTPTVRLAELDFIERGESVIFIGPAASGKSGLASAILLKAIYAGKRALAMTAQKLFDEFTASRADRSTQKLMCRLERLDLFLIEEFGYLNTVEPRQVNDFFQLMDIRCNRKSTMLTTNLGYEKWGKFLGNDSLVAALISRLGQKSRTFAFPKDAVNLRNPKLGLAATAPRPTILNAA